MSSKDFQAHDGLLVVRQTSEGERLRLVLEGEMDLANAETADTAIREAIGSGREVVVDLGGLEFIDSTGISVLVMALQHRGKAALSFLPSKHESVRRLLSLTGLDERMGLVPTAEELTSASAPENPETLQTAA